MKNGQETVVAEDVHLGKQGAKRKQKADPQRVEEARRFRLGPGREEGTEEVVRRLSVRRLISRMQRAGITMIPLACA